MNTRDYISDFIRLGDLINQELNSENTPVEFINAEAKNKWFIQESIRYSLKELSKQLNSTTLNNWLEPYQLTKINEPKTVGLILAGNLPLVGFHDILCTLITGNNVLAKLSHKDEDLYKFTKRLLIEISEDYNHKLIFTDTHLKEIDAIIATGSNNSSRYFDHYFGKYPNIIRRNRNSVGIVDNNFTTKDAEKLGEDIFQYFGLGCRNVSTLLIPDNFDLNILLDGLEPYKQIINHEKYYNNYTYQKTLLAMNNVKFFDNGFSLFTHNQSLSSPIATVHLVQYNNPKDIEDFFLSHKHEIQCIVSKTKYPFDTYSFGKAQKPELWDYADGIDTIEFLKNLT